MRNWRVWFAVAVLGGFAVWREAQIAAAASVVALVVVLAAQTVISNVQGAPPKRLIAVRVAAPVVVFVDVLAALTVGWAKAVVVLVVAVSIWLFLDVGIPSLWHNRALIVAVARRKMHPPEPAATRDLAAEIAAAGWTAYHAAHRFREVDKAPEPGSDAFVILYELTDEPWVGAKVVEVTDASVEGGGRERRALVVGRHHTSAAAALAAIAGLTPDNYMPARQT